MDDDYDHDYEYEEELLPEQEYESILSEIYQDFLNYYNGKIKFEDWRCLVDIHYRKKHGVFPLDDRGLNYLGRGSGIYLRPQRAANMCIALLCLRYQVKQVQLLEEEALT